MAVCKKLFNLYSPTVNSINYFVTSKPCEMVRLRLIEKKLGIPPKPKRPSTPFIKYSMAERQNVLKENPTIAVTETLKEISQKWAKVDPEYKERLQLEYRRDMDQYIKDICEYEKTLTDEQKQLIKHEVGKKKVAVQKLKMKEKLEELGRPKRPPTAFILYMISKKKTKDKDASYFDWLITLAEEWNQLPKLQKQIYALETKKLMDQYKNDMSQWEEKMIKMGHIDVVRRQVLLDLKDKGVE